jgi:hypothetical protein
MQESCQLKKSRKIGKIIRWQGVVCKPGFTKLVNTDLINEIPLFVALQQSMNFAEVNANRPALHESARAAESISIHRCVVFPQLYLVKATI